MGVCDHEVHYYNYVCYDREFYYCSPSKLHVCIEVSKTLLNKQIKCHAQTLNTGA